jgi:hypothetical protein
MPKTATHRFMKTHAGVTSFARVGLELDPDAGEGVSVVFAATDPNPSDGRSDPESAPTWWAAARRGVEAALERADGMSGRVRITLVQGSLVDTSPDAIECAAALATCEVFGLPSPSVSPSRPWTLEWPK